MDDTGLTSAPDADDFRALARSSPWRFSTLHWTHRGSRLDEPESSVEAWLQRPGRLTVRDARGVHVEEGAPYSTSAVLTFPAQATVQLADESADGADAVPGLAPPEQQQAARVAEESVGTRTTVTPPTPVLRADGLVAERPEGYHLDHGDPMWQSYLWTAMLDPEELSHDVELTDIYAAERLGRLTWWATATAREGYDPRCGCCPLLLGQVSVELEYGPFDADSGMRGWESRWDDLPTAYLVGLDVQTGVVVDVTPLDGSGGTRLSNEIHSVDADLAPPGVGDRPRR